MSLYIHQLSDWPHFRWNDKTLSLRLADVRHRQGRLLGRMEGLGFSLRSEALLNTLTLDVLKSSEIEGEILNVEQVRSSIARRLGMDIGALVAPDRHVEGVVEMMLDATQNFDKPLTQERVFGWHAALFPTGYSGLSRITVGSWRNDAGGPQCKSSRALLDMHVCITKPLPPPGLKRKCQRFWTGSIATRGLILS
jgi:Fic family protein